jgi:hypothetical protein
MERGIGHILEVKPGCKGPTWGHAFRKNGSRRAAGATCVSVMSPQQRRDGDRDGDGDEGEEGEEGEEW